MIRPIEPGDWEAVRRIHAAAGLDPACLPDIRNPNFVVSIVCENRHGVTQAGFVKLTGEAFVLVDHEQGTPQERRDDLAQLVAHGLAGAHKYGLDDVSAWLPPNLERSFGGRLVELGWVKSPWPSYSALLR